MNYYFTLSVLLSVPRLVLKITHNYPLWFYFNFLLGLRGIFHGNALFRYGFRKVNMVPFLDSECFVGIYQSIKNRIFIFVSNFYRNYIIIFSILYRFLSIVKLFLRQKWLTFNDCSVQHLEFLLLWKESSTLKIFKDFKD